MKNLARLLLVLGSALSATTALGEVILIAETGFIVENKIQLSSDRRTTWRIFTQQVNDWWPADHTWWGESSTLTID